MFRQSSLKLSIKSTGHDSRQGLLEQNTITPPDTSCTQTSDERNDRIHDAEDL